VSALRDYQIEALAKIDAALAEGQRRIVLKLPTGAGKTRIAAERLKARESAGQRAIFTAPAISLIDQTVDRLFAEGITSVGVM
jgi:DNA repair protein RadD